MGTLRRKAKKAARWLRGEGRAAARAPAVVPAIAARGLLFEEDPAFNALYDAGLARSGSHPTRQTAVVDKRRERFYNLLELFDQTAELPGEVVECGCWRGLGSWLLLSRQRERDPLYAGAGYHVVDSFEGLSEPQRSDRLPASARLDEREFGGARGDFQADLAYVQRVLGEFPRVAYHRGWIPAVLGELPEARYRFVHVDVDLHDPTRGAIEYFYDRLVPAGLLVCDDYGSLRWPGARKAVDEFCTSRKLRPLLLSTGQAALWRR